MSTAWPQGEWLAPQQWLGWVHIQASPAASLVVGSLNWTGVLDWNTGLLEWNSGILEWVPDYCHLRYVPRW